MAKFSLAVAITLQHEGGYVNNLDDKGGPTNFGITQKDFPGVDMKTLTAGQAQTYYYEHYWKAGYSQIEDQDTASKLFDMGVLFGVGTAVRLAQAVLYVAQSEVFDDKTLLAINQRGAPFLPPYKARLRVHAEWIVRQDSSQIQFLNGWENRIGS